MPDFTDRNYLEHEQYKDAHHLHARIELHQRFSTNLYGWFQWVFDQFQLAPEVKILEIGCGPGTLWFENERRLPIGWQLFLSDFSFGMVQEAKKRLLIEKPAYHASNAMALPFHTGTFDAIIANHMLYHVPDRKRALSEINRALKPGGHFFASTIGENHLKELYQITAGFRPTGGMYYSPPLNPAGFTLENGKTQLAPWFANIEVHHYPDNLVITEAQPLLAYILSMIPQMDLRLEKNDIEDLARAINQRITHDGSIFIHKCSGMFVCRKRVG